MTCPRKPFIGSVGLPETRYLFLVALLVYIDKIQRPDVTGGLQRHALEIYLVQNVLFMSYSVLFLP